MTAWSLTITRHRNGMVTVTDEDGQQIPALQGRAHEALGSIGYYLDCLHNIEKHIYTPEPEGKPDDTLA